MLSTAPSFSVPDIAFFGRSLAEYQVFFGIRAADFVGRRVLDIAAGPSSFAAEAACAGVDATAYDPLYRCNEHALRMRATDGLHRMFATMRTRPEMFRLRSFASLDAAEADRRRASERFLADYYTGVAVGRYVSAALPSLPCADASADLVLCGHLLFVYDDRLDLDFHIAACRELARVARADAEVRIHPIVNLRGETSAFVAPVREALGVHGIASEIIDVDYEFFRGTTKTLVLRRGSAKP
jgi:ubiquinone/menaquinone biosynthesis C-methylase UbiE